MIFWRKSIALPRLACIIALTASTSAAFPDDGAVDAEDARAQQILDEAAMRAKYFGPHHESEAGMSFTLLTGAWLPRIVGDAEFDGPAFDFGDDLRLGSREAVFNAELAIRKHERWELHFGGFDFSTSGRGVVPTAMDFGSLSLDPGDVFRSELDMTSFHAELRFTDIRPLEKHWVEGSNNCTACFRPIADLRFIPAVGVRWIDVDHRLEQIGVASERTGGEWLVPYAGLAVQLTHVPEIPFVDWLRLEVGAGFGPALGGDGGFAWHVRSGVTWHITKNFGVFFGYNLLDINAENDDYHMRGGLQGLFVAGSIRF